MRALLGGWNAWLEARGAVEEAGMTKTPETQREASPNPSPDFVGQPPAGGKAPGVKGTPGTASGATSAPAPAKKATTKSRTKRRRPRG